MRAIGVDVCHAPAAVHRAGLIHRDIKAQNVMRDEDILFAAVESTDPNLGKRHSGPFQPREGRRAGWI